MKNIKKYLIVTSVIFLTFIVISCTKEVNSIDYSGKSRISINDLKDFKKTFQINEDNIEGYIDENQTFEKLDSLLGELKFDGEYNPDKDLSMEQAEEDLDKYFSYLKSSYAGYLANGGDDRFLKAKESIIDRVYDGMKVDKFRIYSKKNLALLMMPILQ